MFKKLFKRSKTEAQFALQNVSESAFSEVYLKNHGWQKLLSQGEQGIHEGLAGIYYLVSGFGKVHEKYCKHFR
jgi:CRP-like cAMP-binding protein